MVSKNWTEKAKELRAQGMSYAKIGETVGKSDNAVRCAINPKARAKNRVRCRAYHKRNKEGAKIRQAAYYQANKEKIKEKTRAYYQDHVNECAAYNVGYRKAHKAELKVKDAAKHVIYAQNNKEKIKASGVIYYQANRERISKRSAIYRQNNKSQHSAREAMRRALIAGVTIGNLAEIKEIYRRAQEDQKVRCYLCGRLIPMGHRHVDHIIPVSKGGQHRPSNLAVTCDTCNESKGAKMPQEIGLLL